MQVCASSFVVRTRLDIFVALVRTMSARPLGEIVGGASLGKSTGAIDFNVEPEFETG